MNLQPILPLFATVALLTGAQGQNWNQWRGPDGQGHSGPIPTEWSEKKNVTWKTETPGRGWSSPVIFGNQVWMTYALETEATKEQREERLKANTGLNTVTVLAKATFHALCLDKTSGAVLHDRKLFEVTEPQWVHDTNSYASPTSVIEEGRVYCHFGSFGTAAIDTANGKPIWVNQDKDLIVMHENGPGSTPILWKNHLIFHLDGSDHQMIIALDKMTGDVAWKTPRSGQMKDNPQFRKAYGTPTIHKQGEKEILLSPASDWLYAYDPASGKELWKMGYETLGFSNVPRIVTGNGLLYLCTGFMKSQLLALKLTSDDGPPEVVWRYRKNVPTTPSPILVGDEIYFVSDQGGLVTCLNAHTGDLHWKERIETRNHSGSPHAADGKIYFPGRNGKTTVLKAGPTFEVIATNPIDGKIYSTMAVSGEALFLRSDTKLYRIEKTQSS